MAKNNCFFHQTIQQTGQNDIAFLFFNVRSAVVVEIFSDRCGGGPRAHDRLKRKLGRYQLVPLAPLASLARLRREYRQRPSTSESRPLVIAVE